MSRNRIRLTEKQLHKVIEETVKNMLKENNGFMDGLKGAWNGFRGSKRLGGWNGAMNGAVKGFLQGQEDQQRTIDNNRNSNICKGFGYLMQQIKYSFEAFQNGDLEQVKQHLEWCRKSLDNIQKQMDLQSNQGIDYKYNPDFHRFYR